MPWLRDRAPSQVAMGLGLGWAGLALPVFLVFFPYFWGSFSHSAATAPIIPTIPLFIPGTPLQTTPLQKHA